ncbi:MDR family MFS transporter [Streptomyces sp. TX20-6-3]|uniref:MDR family MFS transporter n=1 Tax=Streptomyces sp. TX20-6-3 TaxID=3028705 RepID=UPI0029BE3B77|nr:MDR family MFS transporter [Streptomyces sp. TX20-6-3]MDX2561404.1 MDR family MFS transporter [Streptomyces sp. TX20-6-3]
MSDRTTAETSADRPGDTDSGEPPQRSIVPLASAGLVLGMLLSVLDQTVVAIALPDIAADIGGADSFSWVVTAYVLASTATGTLYGRLSDRYGRRPLFVIAVLLFVVASLLCGLAQSMPQLIAARVLQGIGAGALFVIPTVTLSELYPKHLRGKVQGLTGAVFAIASVGGPLVGGAITDSAGWRWIFYINIPLGILSVLLCAFALRLPRAAAREKVDLGGSALLIGGVVSLLLITEWGGRDHAWTSGLILGLIAGCLALFALFVWWEGKAKNPLLPMRLFTNPSLRLVLPATAILGMLLYGSVVYMPTFLQTAYDMSATTAGLALNPYFIPFLVVSAVAGGKAGASGRFKPYLLTGAAVLAVAFLVLGMLDLDSPYLLVAGAMAILGVGFGLLMQNLVVVSQNAAAPPDLAATTAANLSIRGLGMAIGVALFGSLLSREIGDGPVTPESTAAAIPEVFVWGVPLALLLTLLIGLLPRTGSAQQRTDQDADDRNPAGGSPEPGTA